MRKSIFDIVKENIDMESEVDRIVTMAEDEEVISDGLKNYTLFDFVDKYCFKEWKHRGHFLDVEDYIETLDIEQIKESAKHSTDELLTLIELVYNFWQLAEWKLVLAQDGKQNSFTGWCCNYYHLKDVMDEILDQFNYVAYINDEEENVLVLENKEEITAVAEILPSELALGVIKYNHKSLKGEIEKKKNILIALGTELEPKRKQLQTVDKKLSDNIFFMLNNMHIRHNNSNKNDLTKYKEYVAKMSEEELEEWYDELYQMILLAFLMIDNVERMEKIKKLKHNINE